MAQANENQRETYERCLDEVLGTPGLGGGHTRVPGHGAACALRSPPRHPPRSSLLPQVANHVVQALLNQKVGVWGVSVGLGGGTQGEPG